MTTEFDKEGSEALVINKKNLPKAEELALFSPTTDAQFDLIGQTTARAAAIGLPDTIKVEGSGEFKKIKIIDDPSLSARFEGFDPDPGYQNVETTIYVYADPRTFDQKPMITIVSGQTEQKDERGVAQKEMIIRVAHHQAAENLVFERLVRYDLGGKRTYDGRRIVLRSPQIARLEPTMGDGISLETDQGEMAVACESFPQNFSRQNEWRFKLAMQSFQESYTLQGLVNTAKKTIEFFSPDKKDLPTPQAVKSLLGDIISLIPLEGQTYSVFYTSPGSVEKQFEVRFE